MVTARRRPTLIGAAFVLGWLSPNVLTLTRLCAAVGVALVIAGDATLAGGVLVLGLGALDALDGWLARAAGPVTPFGAVLDAVVDRCTEALLMGAVLWRVRGDGPGTALLVLTALATTTLAAYVSARAETLGASVRGGSVPGAILLAAVAFGLTTGEIRAGLWLTAAIALTLGAAGVVRVRLLLADDPGDPASQSADGDRRPTPRA